MKNKHTAIEPSMQELKAMKAELTLSKKIALGLKTPSFAGQITKQLEAVTAQIKRKELANG